MLLKIPFHDPIRHFLSDVVFLYGLKLGKNSVMGDSVLISGDHCIIINQTLKFVGLYLFLSHSQGEKASCWYILLSGSVFIEGSMFLPRSR